MLAAAVALHFPLPAAAPPASTHYLGPASGSVGLSLEEYKLLAGSDSEEEAEAGPEAPVAQPAPAAPAPLQQAKASVDPGPVYKYKWPMLQQAKVETLCKDFTHGKITCRTSFFILGAADQITLPRARAEGDEGMGSLRKECGIAQQGRDRKTDCRDEREQSAQELANELSCGNPSRPPSLHQMLPFEKTRAT